jgi:hypothetical protein
LVNREQLCEFVVPFGVAKMGKFAPEGAGVAFLVGVVELESVLTIQCDGLLEYLGVRDIAQVGCLDSLHIFTLVRLPPMEAVNEYATASDGDGGKILDYLRGHPGEY